MQNCELLFCICISICRLASAAIHWTKKNAPLSFLMSYFAKLYCDCIKKYVKIVRIAKKMWEICFQLIESCLWTGPADWCCFSFLTSISAPTNTHCALQPAVHNVQWTVQYTHLYPLLTALYTYSVVHVDSVQCMLIAHCTVHSQCQVHLVQFTMQSNAMLCYAMLYYAMLCSV